MNVVDSGSVFSGHPIATSDNNLEIYDVQQTKKEGSKQMELLTIQTKVAVSRTS